jgi:hypothetical protein
MSGCIDSGNIPGAAFVVEYEVVRICSRDTCKAVVGAINPIDVNVGKVALPTSCGFGVESASTSKSPTHWNVIFANCE